MGTHFADRARVNFRRSVHRLSRKGSIVVLSAFLMVFIMAVLALSIDIGYMQNTSVEMDRAVDAGALAGAGVLANGPEEAIEVAREFVQRNRVGGTFLKNDQVDIQVGAWNRTGRSFASSDDMPYAIRVRAAQDDARPLFFGRVFGRNSFRIGAEAVAMYQPRDIVLVLDYSASMNDDSEFRSIPALGREAIEENLLLIYNELGAPAFGNGTLEFIPQWMTVAGVDPSNEHRPKIHVQYRYNEVYLTSTKPFDRVRIYRSGGSYTQVYGSGTLTADGLYEQTVDYGSNQIVRVDVRSGYNDSNYSSTNKYQESFYFDSDSRIQAHARNAFGLNSDPYPYPAGSWNDYINYCAKGAYNHEAGYRFKFGYMNLVNYWLERREAYSETPTLWTTTEQPITAVKNATSVFLSFLQEKTTDDQLALAVYNSPDGTSLLERELGKEFDQIENISRQRQAGHYHNMTNIGAGIKEAREELDRNARPGAFKMIVLMTDGIANLPSSDPVGYVNEQVALCEEAGYPIVTVSLGAGADVDLMQGIADATGGLHFNVPGGQTVDEYEEDLKKVFREIAEKRPLQLVR